MHGNNNLVVVWERGRAIEQGATYWAPASRARQLEEERGKKFGGKGRNEHETLRGCEGLLCVRVCKRERGERGGMWLTECVLFFCCPAVGGRLKVQLMSRVLFLLFRDGGAVECSLHAPCHALVVLSVLLESGGGFELGGLQPMVVALLAFV